MENSSENDPFSSDGQSLQKNVDLNLIENESNMPKLSKNQQKRLLREAKRKETKTEWRKLQKAKRKLKEQLKREEFLQKGKS